MMVLWTLLVIVVPVHCESNDPKVKVKGLVHETMNVTLDLQNINIISGSNLVCTSEVSYVSFLDQEDQLQSALSGTENNTKMRKDSTNDNLKHIYQSD